MLPINDGVYIPNHARSESDDEDSRRSYVSRPRPAIKYKPTPAVKKPRRIPRQVCRLHRVVGQDEPKYQQPHKPEAERLKSFLTYVLLVDYQIELATKLTSADEQHFASVYRMLCSIKYRANARFTFPPPGTQSLVLRKRLCEPCLVLGIPIEAAATMIMRYHELTGWRGHYQGSAIRVLQTSRLGTFASKLYVDRRILLPSLITTASLYRFMCGKIDDVANRYFKSIEGFGAQMYNIDEKLHWEEIRAIRYVANQSNRALEEDSIVNSKSGSCMVVVATCCRKVRSRWQATKSWDNTLSQKILGKPEKEVLWNESPIIPIYESLNDRTYWKTNNIKSG